MEGSINGIAENWGGNMTLRIVEPKPVTSRIARSLPCLFLKQSRKCAESESAFCRHDARGCLRFATSRSVAI